MGDAALQSAIRGRARPHVPVGATSAGLGPNRRAELLANLSTVAVAARVHSLPPARHGSAEGHADSARHLRPKPRLRVCEGPRDPVSGHVWIPEIPARIPRASVPWAPGTASKPRAKKRSSAPKRKTPRNDRRSSLQNADDAGWRLAGVRLERMQEQQAERENSSARRASCPNISGSTDRCPMKPNRACAPDRAARCPSSGGDRPATSQSASAA